ncbi:hypothetical protein LIER_24861 [Lithospermum erythrorhizon]|uniref:Uncharacterized protein n=1 Tax=Lithospermum erythrorhizon TaxID=34254 RepID=A0AAV3R5U8_LITER
MSALDYETKFNELSQFFGAITDDDVKKAKRFLKGLRGEIRIFATSQIVTTYANIVDRASNFKNEVEVEKPKAPENKRNANLQPLQYVGQQENRENFEGNNFRKQRSGGRVLKSPGVVNHIIRTNILGLLEVVLIVNNKDIVLQCVQGRELMG